MNRNHNWYQSYVSFSKHSIFFVVPLTIAIFMLLAFYVVGTYRDFNNIREYFKITEKTGTVARLDEVLTMSAKMAAATGNLDWEQRYLKYDPELSDAIDKAIAFDWKFCPATHDHGTNIRTANDTLVEMEKRSFNLVRAGQLDAAAALLNSSEYEIWKKTYQENLDDLSAEMALFVKTECDKYGLSSYVIIILTLMLFLLLAYLFLISIMQRKYGIAIEGMYGKSIEDEQRFRIAAKSVSNLIWEWDISTEKLEWFGDIDGILGYAPGEFHRDIAAWEKIIHAEDHDRAMAAIDRSVKHREDYDQTYRVLRKDGGIVFWRDRASVICDRNGNIVKMIGAVSDVTNQKMRDRALIEAKDSANASNRLKSEFLANMSHEIRTPMNAVIGFSELLSHEITDKRHREFLDKIVSNGNMLLKLIGDILDLSKIEANRLVLETSPVEIDILFRDVVQSFNPMAEKKGISLALFIPRDIQLITCDEARIRQILYNIIGNAIKYTDKGVVEVRAETTAAGEDGSCSLKFTVSDTGRGILSLDQQFIFEPFATFGKHHAGESTGIGLSIVKRLVDLMGGKTFIESQPGKGTVFTVVIPVTGLAREKTGVTDNEECSKTDIVFKGSTVLLVENDMDHRLLLKEMLSAANLKIIEAADGKLGIEMAKTCHPDLIIHDLSMPDIGGFESVKAIRTHEELSGKKPVPVIILSASSQQYRSEDATFLNISDFLVKPVPCKKLKKTISRFLPHEILVKSGTDPVKPENEFQMQGSEELRRIFPMLDGEIRKEVDFLGKNMNFSRIGSLLSRLEEISAGNRCAPLNDFVLKFKARKDCMDFEGIRACLDEYFAILEKMREVLEDGK